MIDRTFSVIFYLIYPITHLIEGWYQISKMSVPPNTSKLDSFKTQQPKCLFEGKPFFIINFIFFHRLIELTFFIHVYFLLWIIFIRTWILVMDQSSVNLIFKSMYRTFWEFFLDISLSLAVRIRPCSYNNLNIHTKSVCKL